MITDIKNWTEVTRGLYRYVIAAKAAYEIHVMYLEDGMNLLDAPAQLFIVGEWYEKEKGSFFERENLTPHAVIATETVRSCLLVAKSDNEQNNQHSL